MNSKIRKLISFLLVIVLMMTFIPAFTMAEEVDGPDEAEALASNFEDILDLPIAWFDVYGTEMDRGVLIAVAANGVFISWRFFPEEATGFNNTTKSLIGNNFAIFKNGVWLADVTNSTNYLDPAGTVGDSYVIVTIDPDGNYVSRSKVHNPAPRLTTGISAGAATAGVLTIPVQRPAANVGPANSGTGTTSRAYNMDQIAVGWVDDSGDPVFLVKWETGSPDVISQGHNGPVIWDCYTLGGTLLWRIDLGVNFRPGQHYGIGIFFDYSGRGGADFMVKTAPGSRSMEVIDGRLTGNFTYIGQQYMGANPEVETRVTRWDGTRNWQNTDDYRNYDGNTNAANRIRAQGTYSTRLTSVSMMSDMFMNWHTHPEVTSALHGANLEFDAAPNRKCSKAGCEGHGWWMYPPQVMLGMFPANYPERDPSRPTTAGKHWNSFLTNLANTANADVAQWTQAVWQRLKDLPTNPCDFKDVVITRQLADDLAIFWRVVSRDTNGGDRYTGSGHIACGPEFMTVFCGKTGVELATTEYAVPRGTFRADGSYVPDIGLMWNDFTTNQPEPYNRVYRHHSMVAYLDGIDNNPSRVENRGQYSRFTLTRYDWDGENLTSEVITDSGFEALPNPFANGGGNRGGMVNWANTHGGPGRMEVTFNPAAPRDELRPAGVTGANLLRWLQQNGSITVQSNHQVSAMDLTGDGKDNIVMGALALNPDGSTLWAGYQARYQGNTGNLNYGAIEKIGHGDSMFLGYFHPNQEIPQYWTCLEGAWWDNALINARTGEIMHTSHTNGGSATTWGAARDNGRTAAGFFRAITGQSGWQLQAAGTAATRPSGSNGGTRQWNGNVSSVALSPGSDFNIFWRPDLTTSPCNASISTINAAGTSFGTGNPGGLATTGNRVCGGTKNRPGFVGDILGDYREELVLGATDGSSIRIYFNTEDSPRKMATMQADRRYRVELERQKSVYGQPVLPSYYWGSDINMAVYFESIKPLVDKNNLIDFIDAIIDFDFQAGDYTAASFARYIAALDAAIAVLENSFSTQRVINDALGALLDAIEDLILVKDLKDKIVDIEVLELEQIDFTLISWTALLDALKDAAAVLDDEYDATQEEIDDALDALSAAFEALVWVKDLKDLIAEIEGLKLKWQDYTIESWDDLIEALADAEVVLDDEYDATQEEINEALDALIDALDGLTDKLLIKSVPAAWVRVFPGNMNELFITVTEYYCNGTDKDIEAAIFIRNNAASTYNVGSYKVYVDTKGNDQIRQLYIVK